MRKIVLMAHHGRVNKKNYQTIFIVTPHPMLPISQESTDAHSIFKDTLFSGAPR
jgi:hypothetical protein